MKKTILMSLACLLFLILVSAAVQAEGEARVVIQAEAEVGVPVPWDLDWGDVEWDSDNYLTIEVYFESTTTDWGRLFYITPDYPEYEDIVFPEPGVYRCSAHAYDGHDDVTTVDTFVTVKSPNPPIESTEVTITAPKAGAKPSYTASFPSDAHYTNDTLSTDYTKNGIMWRNITDEHDMEADGSEAFAAGKEYQVNIYLVPAELYAFSENCTGKINGKTAEMKISENDTIDWVRLSCRFKVSTKPKITTQPSDVSATEGKAATFKVAASGTGIKYQWQYIDDSGWQNVADSNAKKASWTFTPDGSMHKRIYRCKVSNDGGAVYSNMVTLTVKPGITTQPKDLSATEGKNATLKIAANGKGLTYQWQYKASSGWKNASGSSAKKAAYTFKPDGTMNGRQYRCKVTNCGGASVYSKTVTLSVKPNITTQPKNVYVKDGETATMKVAVSGTGLSYQWQYETSSGWKNASGAAAKKATYKFEAAKSMNGYQYRCKVTNSSGGTVYSQSAVLIVNEMTPDEKIKAFVKRCYKIILGREADSGGLKTWFDELKSGRKAASEIIDRFVNSSEFQGKKYSNAQSVEILYKAMLGRSSDAAGKKNWVSKLDAGQPFAVVINGFCVSKEFKEICASYGIKPGSVTIPDNSPEGKIKAFVKRCYSIILGREADASGLETWYKELSSGRKAASEIIDKFVNSSEFKGKKYSNEDAVEILYQAMMGRGSDPSGKANWVAKLNAGQPFAVVINGFCNSAEFKGICASYGIKPGSVTVTAAEELPQVIGEAAAAQTGAGEKKEPSGSAARQIILPSEEDNDQLGAAVMVVYYNEAKVTEFVQRCYRSILGREAGREELNTWTAQLMNGQKTPDQIARGFLFSQEFKNRNTGNGELVKILYRVYMNREADPEGLATWTAKLDEGLALKDLLDYFAKTNEFKKIVNELKN